MSDDVIARALQVAENRERHRARRDTERLGRFYALLTRRTTPKPRDAERIAFLMRKLGVTAEQLDEHIALADSAVEAKRAAKEAKRRG